MRIAFLLALASSAAFAGTVTYCTASGQKWVCACGNEQVYGTTSPDCLLGTTLISPTGTNGYFDCAISCESCTPRPQGEVISDSCTGTNLTNGSGCRPPEFWCITGTARPDPFANLNTSTGAKGNMSMLCDQALKPVCENLKDTGGGKCETVGGPVKQGDPISLVSGSSTYETTDLQLETSLGRLELQRRFTLDPRDWAYEQLLSNSATGAFSNTYLHVPFGHDGTGQPDAGTGTSLYWSHSFYSFVIPRQYEGDWMVRTGDGRVLSFAPCATAPCFGAASSKNRGDARLQWDGTNFTLHEGERRYVFTNPTTFGGSSPMYFLKRIESRAANATIATINYSPVPVITSVVTVDGAELLFHYTGGVLTSVGLKPTGGSETTEVSYSYASFGALNAVALTQVTYAGARGVESYDYPLNGWRLLRNGVLVTEHFLPGGGTYNPSDSERGIVRAARGAPPVGTACARFGCVDAGVENWTEWTSAGNGGNSGLGTPVSVDIYTEASALTRGRMTREIRRGARNGEAPGPVSQEWAWANVGDGLIANTHVKNERNAWTIDEYQMSVATLPANIIRAELRTRYEGSLDAGAGAAVLSTGYSYSYVGPGYSQEVTQESKASVLQSGQQAKVVRSFDVSTGRLKAEFRSGYTSTWASGTWSNVTRTIGTFYFTNRVCSGTGSDPFGRVLEVHGPCLAASTSSTDCSASQGIIPITQYTYYGATGTADANRLQSMTQYTSASSVTACSGQTLTTTFSNYDAFGHAQTVTDPNGVVTTFVWDHDQLLSRTVNGRTTTYTYEDGKVTSIRSPEGNYEVFCYRNSPLSSGCSAAAPLTDRLQWRAKAPNATATSYTEAVAYTYYPDGTVATEAKWDGASGQRRELVSLDHDARGNVTWKTLGTVGTPAELKVFNATGGLAGISKPYLTTNLDCGAVGTNGSVSSSTCSSLFYDAVDRLRAADPGGNVAATEAGRTCFSYDAHSNVASVKTGCPVTSDGDCSACTSLATLYKADDFGNLVSMEAPWAGATTPGGATRMQYDARGNTLRKISPTMAAEGVRLDTTWDGLNRPLQLRRLWSGGTETLWTNTWDVTTLNANCPQPSNTLGRLARRQDTFGKTHFQYSPEGWVVGEVRLRGSSTSCATTVSPNNVPHTFYEYSANGNRTAVVYPFGRRVEYVYGTSGGVTTDRIASVNVFTRGASSWTSWAAITGVRWEPFGGLRGYQLNPPSSATPIGVEWARGDGSRSTAESVCPQPFPVFPGDSSGLVRGLWVSRGAWVPGSGAGDVFHQKYQYSNETVTNVASCYLNTGHQTEYWLYWPDNVGNVGWTQLKIGYYGSQLNNYLAFDARGNRTSFSYPLPGTSGYSSDNYDYSTTFSDRLTAVRPLGSTTWATNYTHDADGRVATIQSANDSSGLPNNLIAFGSATSGTVASGGLDSVYKTATVNGAVYSYYYDAKNRRRLKTYPTGVSDESFHSLNDELLVEVGVNALSGVTSRPTDEYVWLGGRPVLAMRGRLSSAYARQADSQTACGRNGEATECGAYFIVTDFLGKPVLVLDAAGKVSEFLQPVLAAPRQRGLLRLNTASPYGGGGSLGNLDLPPLNEFGVPMKLRFRYGFVDTEGTAAAPVDAVQARTYSGGSPLANLGSPVGGAHRGKVWSEWVTADAGTHIQFDFGADGKNCAPGVSCMLADGGFTADAGWPYSGVMVEGYEVTRMETGAKPYRTSLGFPGQKYDDETDVYENWNRYYDWKSGRYLSPEPLLRRPGYVKARTGFGTTMPTYAYANNNPVRYTDSTGLFTTDYESEGKCATYYWAALRAQQLAGCDSSGKNNASCDCNNRISSCTNGCDICEFLAFGKGPDLFFDSSGGNDWSSPGIFGGPSTHIDPATCDWAHIDELANSFIHEAMHHCEQRAFGWMSDRGWPFEQSTTTQCGVSGNTNACFGGAWELGKAFP